MWTGGQRSERHGSVHHVQEEHHKSIIKMPASFYNHQKTQKLDSLEAAIKFLIQDIYN